MDKEKKKVNNALHNIIASSIGTSIAEVLTIPICSIKTNYQTNLNYNSIREVARDIYNTRGMYGFYNSSFMAISSQIVSTASKFTFYNMIKGYRGTTDIDFKNNMLNGGMAGILSSVLTHPIDVVKIHQQQNQQLLPIIKQEGLSVLYRGYSKTFYKNILLTSTLFPIYDVYTSHFDNPVLSALMASITVSTILHPVDYLKVRHVSNKPLWQGYNPIHYYRGFCINLLRATPHFMITMGITEAIKKYLNRI